MASSSAWSARSLLAALWVPAFAWLAFGLKHSGHHPALNLVAAIALIMVVLNAVHHAEVIAHRIGEPFGALVLALAITIIEASIILSMMQGDDQSHDATLARDTVFAAVMIILTGMTGLTLLIGGIRYKEQAFGWQGVSSTLTVLVTISVLTLILPNFTTSAAGPYYSTTQLLFVAIISLLLYGSFLFVQNFRHRNHFVADDELDAEAPKPGKRDTLLSSILLPVCLLAVVLLAESMAPDLEHFIESVGAPDALAGIIIALIILLPEGISAVKAAAQNKMQRSLNLSLGSALASISLTIPVVSVYCVVTQTPLALGIGNALSVLFLLSLLVIVMSLGKGRTNILHGIVLLLLFAVYLFISLFP